MIGTNLAIASLINSLSVGKNNLHHILFEPPHDKTNKMACVPSEDWSAWASSLSTQWIAKDPSFFHVDSEDSDHAELIWVFAGRTFILLVLSCGSLFATHIICDIIWVLNSPSVSDIP